MIRRAGAETAFPCRDFPSVTLPIEVVPDQKVQGMFVPFAPNQETFHAESLNQPSCHSGNRRKVVQLPSRVATAVFAREYSCIVAFHACGCALAESQIKLVGGTASDQCPHSRWKCPKWAIRNRNRPTPKGGRRVKPRHKCELGRAPPKTGFIRHRTTMDSRRPKQAYEILDA